MKMLKFVGLAALATALVGGAVMVGCGDSGTTTYDAAPTAADAKPADAGGGGTATVNFGPVDDSANKVYQAGDLEWKGAMTYDSTTNTITPGSDGWGNNKWAVLYDDGPVPTGHEPPTYGTTPSAANDNKWGVQIKVGKPVTGETNVEYGLNDKSYRLKGFDGWVWPSGPNGTFKVTPTSTSVNASGMTFAKFGTTDVRFTLDLSMLQGGPPSDAGPAQWNTAVVMIKSSWWSWGAVPVTVTSGKAVIVLSDIAGAGKTFNHTGLMGSTQSAEFVWQLCTAAGAAQVCDEYKISGKAAKPGVTAEYKPSGGAFTALPVLGGDASKDNTYVTIP